MGHLPIPVHLWVSAPLSVGRSGPVIQETSETSPRGGGWERRQLLHVLLGQHALNSAGFMVMSWEYLWLMVINREFMLSSTVVIHG